MRESAEVDAKVSKKEFEEQVPRLRVDLVNAQYDLQQADFPVILVIAGDDRIGCNVLVDRLHEWLDARYIQTHVFGKPTEEQSERPRFWRYWTSLPPNGKIGLFGGAWPLNAVADRVNRELGKKAYAARLQHMREFERELAADGALILKFWIHLPRKEMKKRLKESQKHPDRMWWIEDVDWDIYESHEEAVPVVKEMMGQTDAAYARWVIVDGTDGHHRDLTVATTIRDVLQRRLQDEADEVVASRVPEPAADLSSVEVPDALAKVDLSKTLEKDVYRKRLEKYQRKVNGLMREVWQEGSDCVLAFEGWDAAGKGGVIRRITNALPARSYNVVPIAAPTEEEKQYHYLWRFWKHLPRAGRLVIFDRSWYGRVLVERIEQFAAEREWRRAYDEINDFEQQLVDHGIPVLKFWLHISPEEQLRRFEAREQTDYKKYKITDEDYRNREKWDAYVEAVNEMVALTGTNDAPWHLIPANNKRYARIQVLKIVCDALEKALKQR